MFMPRSPRFLRSTWIDSTSLPQNYLPNPMHHRTQMSRSIPCCRLIPCRLRTPCCLSRTFHPIPHVRLTQGSFRNETLIPGHILFPCSSREGSLHPSRFPNPGQRPILLQALSHWPCHWGSTRYLARLECLWSLSVPDSQSRRETFRRWNVVRRRVSPRRQSGLRSYRRP